MIRGDNPVAFPEKLDEIAVEKRPGRIAVQHDNDLALSFIDIGEAVAIDIKLFSFEWILIISFHSRQLHTNLMVFLKVSKGHSNTQGEYKQYQVDFKVYAIYDAIFVSVCAEMRFFVREQEARILKSAAYFCT